MGLRLQTLAIMTLVVCGQAWAVNKCTGADEEDVMAGLSTWQAESRTKTLF